MRRVIVHVDRLVLRGFPYEDRHALAEGLRRELGRLIAEPGVARTLVLGGDSARRDAGLFHVAPGTQPGRIGAHAARNILAGNQAMSVAPASRASTGDASRT